MKLRDGQALALLGLLLVPLGWKAWADFRELAEFEARQVAAQRAATLEAAGRVREQLAARAGELRARAEASARAGAAAFARAWPFRGPGLALREAVAAAGVPCAARVVSGAGRVLLPAPPGEVAHPHLPEWPAFLDLRARAARDPALWVDAAPRFTAPVLRATAFAAAGDRAALLAMDPATVAAAGARAVELARHGPGGAEWLAAARERGLLAAVPATPELRRAWGGAGAPERALEVEVPLPEGASLQLLIDAPKAVQGGLGGGETVDGRAVRYRVLEAQAKPGVRVDPESGEGVVVTDVLGVPVEARVADPARASFSAFVEETRAFRTVALFGGYALVCVCGVGLWWAFRRERAARRLRDEFVANVSHDLRTPLASMRLHAEMLADPAVPAGKRAAYAATVEAEGARLTALVEDLLDFAALERGTRRLEPEPVDLAAAAAATAAPWRATGGPAFAIEGAGTALADPTALTRILGNLAANACKHARASRVVFRVADGAVEVRDDGVGVPPGVKVFERFVGGRARAGLGLALSRDLARAMGGDLTLDRRDGWTVFRLTLPRALSEDGGP